MKSLQQLCIDFFNIEGPNLIDTVLKVELPPLEDDPIAIAGDNESSQFAPDSQDDSQEPTLNSAVVKKRKKFNPLSVYVNRKRHRRRLGFGRRRKNPPAAINGPTANKIAAYRSETIHKKIVGPVPLQKKGEPNGKRTINIRCRRPASALTQLTVVVPSANGDGHREVAAKSSTKTYVCEVSPGTSRTNFVDIGRKISEDNVISGKRQRTRPSRLSDVLTEKVMLSKRIKLELAKAERQSKSLEKKFDEREQPSPVPSTPTVAKERRSRKADEAIEPSPPLAKGSKLAKKAVGNEKANEDSSPTMAKGKSSKKVDDVTVTNEESPIVTKAKLAKKVDDSSKKADEATKKADNASPQSESKPKSRKKSPSQEAAKSCAPTPVRAASSTPPIRSKSSTPLSTTSSSVLDDATEIKDETLMRKIAMENAKLQKKKINTTTDNEDKKHRSKTRINYSEALVDEALMYEEILMDKEAKEQLVIATTIEASKKAADANSQKTVAKGKNNFSFDYDDTPPAISSKSCKASIESNAKEDDSKSASVKNRLSEISITPISKLSELKSGADKKIGSVSLSDLKKSFKSNPDTVLNISSAVSIQLKSPAMPAMTMPMFADSALSPDLDGPQTCTYCGEQYADIKILAIHQLQHLSVATRRISDKQILDPKFRRGRMVPMGSQKCFRCLNCWRLHPNSQSILEHWVTGKCLFYCSLCGDSFHTNPKMIRIHFPIVHGIKYKMPDEFVGRDERVLPQNGGGVGGSGKLPMAPGTKLRRIVKIESEQERNRIRAKLLQQQQRIPMGRVTCEICSCSFPNMQSRNSHMRLHKKERIVEQMTMPGNVLSINTAIQQPPSTVQLPSGRMLTLKSGQQVLLKPGQHIQLKPSHMIRSGQQVLPRNVIRMPIGGSMRSNQQRPQPGNMRIQIRPPQQQQNASGIRINQVQGNVNVAQRQSTIIMKSNNYHEQQQPPRKIAPRIQPSSQQQRVISHPQTFTNSYSSIEVKAELPEIQDDFIEYNSTDYSNDYMMPADFNNILPLQPEVVMNTSTGICVKAEPNSGTSTPRLQVKKLHELQEPTYSAPKQPQPQQVYYQAHQHQSVPVVAQQTAAPTQPTTIQHHQPQTIQTSPIQHAVPTVAQQTAPTATIIQQPQQYQIAPQHIQLQVPQMQTIQFQSQPQFQITSAQQVQNTQYYNPVFVVQHPQQTTVQPDIYQYTSDQIDYTKYYS